MAQKMKGTFKDLVAAGAAEEAARAQPTGAAARLR